MCFMKPEISSPRRSALLRGSVPAFVGERLARGRISLFSRRCATHFGRTFSTPNTSNSSRPSVICWCRLSKILSATGAKALHLRKHRKRVDFFYRDTMDVLPGQQEIFSKYKKRFERYRDSMFTFLDEDEIPWNNNAAERALRHLAVQRKISGDFSEKGASGYLRLLAIAQTCRFQNKSFLGILLSGLNDVDQYQRKRRQRSSSDGSLEID
jgi:hypothetical protein